MALRFQSPDGAPLLAEVGRGSGLDPDALRLPSGELDSALPGPRTPARHCAACLPASANLHNPEG